MPRKKVRVKDLKKQRWAAIVAAILALGMLLSLVGVYIGQAIGGSGTEVPETQTEPQPEDYLAYYSAEVERLEEFLADNDPTEPLLLELAENYRYLVFIQQVFFDEPQAVDENRERLADIFVDLVQLNPDNYEYRYELVSLYLEMNKDDAVVNAQIDQLREKLYENPEPMVHLALINLLSTTERDAQIEEELEWLRGYLEPLYETGEANSEELFYYSVLIGEYYNEREEAKQLLVGIMAAEPEESRVYQDAAAYLNYLDAENDSDAEAAE